MTKRSFRALFAFTLVLALFLSIEGCSKKSTNSNPPPSPTPNQILIQNFSFQPDSLAVDSGATVTWINRDSAPHTVTSDSAGYFNSPTLNTNDSFPFTFQKKGTFGYHCTIHPSMKGKIVVK